MALVALGSTRCPLCGEAIEAGQPLVASQFVGPYGEQDLGRFCDLAVHRTCFLTWEFRDEFIRQHDRHASYPLDLGKTDPPEALRAMPRARLVQPKRPGNG